MASILGIMGSSTKYHVAVRSTVDIQQGTPHRCQPCVVLALARSKCQTVTMLTMGHPDNLNNTWNYEAHMLGTGNPTDSSNSKHRQVVTLPDTTPPHLVPPACSIA